METSAPTPDTRPPQTINQGHYQCSHCQRTFSRADHLQRHVRSHIQDRPFRCETCHKGFGRQDLLKRHAACHEADEQGVKRPRRQLNPGPRVSQACKACAAAKLKCDEDRVCARCLRKGISCEREARNGANSAANKSPGIEQGEDVADNITVDTTLCIGQNGIDRDGVDKASSPKTQDSPKTQLMGEGPAVPLLDFDFSSFIKNVMTAPTGGGVGTRILDDVDWSVMGSLDPFAQTQDFLDFTTQGDFGFEDVAFNFSTLPHTPSRYFGDGPPDLQPAAQEDGKYMSLNIEAYRQSVLGQWEPSHDDKGGADVDSLSVLGPSPHSSICVTQLGHPDPHQHKSLTTSARDEVLSMTLDMCKPERKHLVTKTFPTADLFLKLVQHYFGYDRHQVYSFIHSPTFELDQQQPELLASIISMGAVLADSKPLNALGLALQEVIRLSLPERFEESNMVTRTLWALQAFISEIDMGLWTGIKRKMEIAESHRNMPFTMLRRSARFGKPRMKLPAPLPSDTGDVLHQKWLAWVQQESFNRLVYRSFIMDIQISIAIQTMPHISFSELGAPMPVSRFLWFANDAEEWKLLYLTTMHREQTPCSLVDYLRDPCELDDSYDVTFAQLIILSGIWGMIWQYIQLRQALNKPKSSCAALALQHQEILHILEQYQIHAPDDVSMRAESCLMLDLVQMHLYMPFGEVESFAGKGTVEEARQALPALREWALLEESRKAIWYAGQVLRAADNLRPGHLRGFFAIAVYQATLTLWVYSVISQGRRAQEEAEETAAALPRPAQVTPTPSSEATICLNGSGQPAIKRFFSRGKATSCVLQRSGLGSQAGMPPPPLPLADLEAVTRMVADILGDNYANCQAVPPLVENLQQLLRQLGRAATSIRAGFPASETWATSRPEGL